MTEVMTYHLIVPTRYFFYLKMYIKKSVTILGEAETGYMSRLMKNQQNDCAPSEDSDQPGHQPSLIRVFAMHSMGS